MLNHVHRLAVALVELCAARRNPRAGNDVIRLSQPRRDDSRHSSSDNASELPMNSKFQRSHHKTALVAIAVCFAAWASAATGADLPRTPPSAPRGGGIDTLPGFDGWTPFTTLGHRDPPAPAVAVARDAAEPWFTVAIASPAGPTRVAYAEDFGVSIAADDNTDAFMDAVAACRPGSCLLTFRNSGLLYRFAGGKAYNALTFANLTDFVFDGQGSTLLFSRPNMSNFGSGFLGWSCSPEPDSTFARPEAQRGALVAVDSVVRGYFGNFVIDWDNDKWPVASLVRIVAATGSSWTVEFVDWPGEVDLSKLAGYRSLHMVDPDLHYCGLVEGGIEFYPPYMASKPTVTKLSSKIVRIDWDREGGVPPTNAAQKFLLKHLDYDFHGIVIQNAREIQMDRIRSRLVPGMLFVASDGSEGLSFTNIVSKLPAEPNPGDVGNTLYPRHLSAASDGIFLEQTSGRIRISNVTLENMGDDCLNVHDVLAVDISAPNATYPPPALTYPARPPADQPWTVDLLDPRKLHIRGLFAADFFPGDVVEFVDPTTFTVVHTDKVVKSTNDRCGDWQLEFETALHSGLYFSNGRWNPTAAFLRNTRFRASKVLVDNLVCSNTRARGFLLQTSDTIVANSKISDTAMACVFVRSDLIEREGGGLSHLGMYGNVFEGCDRNRWNLGALDVHVWGDWSNGTRKGSGIYDAAFRGNVFRGIEEPVLAVSASTGLAFDGNVVSTSYLPAVTVTKAVTPEFVNNTFHNPGIEHLGTINTDLDMAARAVLVDNGTVSGAVIVGNVYPTTAPSEQPQRFKMPAIVPFVPVVPVDAAVLPVSRGWSSKLDGLPDCKKCSANGYPADGSLLCICRRKPDGTFPTPPTTGSVPTTQPQPQHNGAQRVSPVRTFAVMLFVVLNIII